MKRKVIIGFLGTTLDGGSKEAKRWARWRPTVALCQQEGLHIDRLELLHATKFAPLNEQVVADIAKISPNTKVISHIVEMKDAWDFEEVYSMLLDFSRSYSWNEEDEEYFLHISTGTHVGQICMFLLAEARYFPAKLIQTSPSVGTENSSIGTHRIIDLDLSKYDRISSRFHKVKKDDLSFLKSGIETRNKKFNDLIERIERVAIVSKEPILLLGPTGAGKSQLARRIYELKKSRNQVSGAFIDVNCATLRGDAAMSALFGHIKGSFTGAAQSRDGYLRSAHQGILFLDEIGELGCDEQAMLLRAIEEKSFFPVGSDKEVQSDFQLIAGTNSNLQTLTHEGSFRDDLLARINLWSFKLPGLRDRREDIAPNIEYELNRYSHKNNAHVSFNKEARDSFLNFAISADAIWSSNFRDLNAAVTRMATLADSGKITVAIVDDEIQRLKESWPSSTKNQDQQALCNYFNVAEDSINKLDRFDRIQLLDVLSVCKSSPSLAEAGRQLFAHSRKDKPNYNDADRLKKYLARFGIDWKGRKHIVESN